MQTSPNQKPKPVPALNVWAIASELGFIIAIPLVLLILGGVKADRYFNTTPLFIIIAILIAPVISGIAIWRKIKTINSTL